MRGNSSCHRIGRIISATLLAGMGTPQDCRAFGEQLLQQGRPVVLAALHDGRNGVVAKGITGFTL